MSEAKVGLSANVWVEVVGLFMVVLDFVNVFGFVPLHVLKPAMRISVSSNMLFGIAACYSRESAPAMPITSGATVYMEELARPLRIEFEDAIYHLCARGNPRQPIFRDERDCARFLELRSQPGAAF
jgi:hypothetical protein